MFSLPGSAEPTMTKKLWVDNIVCRLAIDLQTPADMFHFLCSRCVSLILRECSDITRATWVDDWWCPLVNIVCYICAIGLKIPMSSTASSSFFPPHHSPTLLYFPLFSPIILLPFICPLLHQMLLHHSCFPLHSSPPLLHLSSLKLFFVATTLQLREEWDHLAPFIFLRGGDRSTGWKYRALGCKWRAIQIKNGPLILQMLYVLRDNIIKCSFSLLPV